MIRKTKIIATIGPSTDSKNMLRKLIEKGVNVCRLNFSHLNHETAKKIISNIKEINQETHSHTAILADLQGPKIRIGDLKAPIKLKKGQEVIFSTRKKKHTIQISYQKFAKEVKKKEKVILDDGNILLEVVSTNNKDTVVLRSLFSAVLKSKKGVNLPNTKTSIPCLTKKDKKDLEFILSEKIEWIGLSFVRTFQDIRTLRKIIKKKSLTHKIIAKIEKPEAIRNIKKIIEYSDAVMVARGDLGVEVPPQKVPVYQKMIVNECIINAKPVIIATQMLESMTENPRATRAETNDIANAVIDGVDAVMLSGETSVGKHPLKSVDAMRKIIKNVEGSEHNISKNLKERVISSEGRVLSNAICSHACDISETIKARAIITATQSGFNTVKTSSFRPHAFIYAFTNNHTILNTLSLVWGVKGFYYDRGTTTDQTIEETKIILKKEKYLKKGDLVVSLASMPAKQKGMTNMMKISKIE